MLEASKPHSLGK